MRERERERERDSSKDHKLSREPKLWHTIIHPRENPIVGECVERERFEREKKKRKNRRFVRMEFCPIFGTRKTTSAGDGSSTDDCLPRTVKRKVKRKRVGTFEFGRDVIRTSSIDDVVKTEKQLGQGQFGRVLVGVCKKTNLRVAYKEMKIVRGEGPSKNVLKIFGQLLVVVLCFNGVRIFPVRIFPTALYYDYSLKGVTSRANRLVTDPTIGPEWYFSRL